METNFLYIVIPSHYGMRLRWEDNIKIDLTECRAVGT
jgi:hypothetical protein